MAKDKTPKYVPTHRYVVIQGKGSELSFRIYPSYTTGHIWHRTFGVINPKTLMRPEAQIHHLKAETHREEYKSLQMESFETYGSLMRHLISRYGKGAFVETDETGKVLAGG